MFSDLRFIIFWWLVIFLLGTLSLPLTFLIFKKFWDKGYLFSKIISLTLLTYLIFVFSVFHFLPFSHSSIFLLILLLAGLDVFIVNKFFHHQKLLEIFQKNYRLFLFEELIFVTILVFWSFIRGFSPDIEGLEKFMDWGFVNSALRSSYLPPTDMWFSGSPINYYYFGHLIFALLTKISGISSAITYNLSIATVCALAFSLTFSLSSNLVFNFAKKIKPQVFILSGLISALLLTFGGNLHPLYKIAKINIKNNGRLTLTSEAIKQAQQSYWYPDATRFIGHDPDTKDKTIHEFPIYSFVVADLHGHMNDIGTVIFFLAFLFSLSLSFPKTIPWFLSVPVGLTLSISYMTNAWNFAVYGLLLAIFLFLRNISCQKLSQAFTQTFSFGILTIIFWYLFTLPFSLNFIPMMEGIKISDVHSPFYQLFILYGGFWLICFPFVLFVIRHLKFDTKKLTNSDVFILSLILTATILIIIPELIYIKDIYIFEHRRSNTMFKLVYQAFMLYSVVSAYVLFRLSHFRLYKLLFFLVFVSHLIYPFFAIKSYYGLKEYRGLWGLNFLKTNYPDNFAAIDWINQNISGQPVMLEAVGDSYTTFNQVSTVTGLPTVEGWIVHEWLWRGGYDQPAARQADVLKIFESENLTEAKNLLQKYDVDYVFVGDKEREKYSKLNETTFSELGTIVFQSNQTKIYKLIK